MQDFLRLDYLVYLFFHIWYFYSVDLSFSLYERHAIVLCYLYLDLHLSTCYLEIDRCLYLLHPGYCLSVDLARSDILSHLLLLPHILHSLIPFLYLLGFLLIRIHPLMCHRSSSSLIHSDHLLRQSFYIYIVLVLVV